MKRYIAFLRGININGKNKIAMAELKTGFENLGFQEVKTLLNSGNVVFSTHLEEPGALIRQISEMIKERFALDIPVFVLEKEALEDILEGAPDWWGTEDKGIYDNLIFVMPPATFAEVYNEIGAPKEGLERIQEYHGAIFWSFDRAKYQKTNWWSKTASADISRQLTIRTANTVRKLIEL